ncbi:hypothetical protein COT78_02205 [Candidatus Berkelbacteria bacterium CG10_big_fil_rev_8_21_14_0_10_43_13]|uniref:PpiC domain-containing protein n=1 Tax=Candidatus Berkelbacteria bacterium CG10_big_fil_rev_8_21_14_0_10_43_13 TaxID=1974514 RepID=A0A2H0W6G6_9BACT|nr:MAG: hypothetical protein COT78_02205 [Candidatus Berkelbacteria bacterium CG10_big_fil_rev_8_21_14_0_10_43_13]
MLKKFYDKLRSVCRKIVLFSGRVWAKFIAFCGRVGDKLTLFSKTKAYAILAKVVVVLVVLLALVQFVFGIMIYGYKVENKATKFVAKVLPYPVAVVNYDFVTYTEYEKEKDYIHHFYAATQQGSIDYKSIDSQILVQLIENKIILFEALKYHVKVNKKEVDDAVDNITIQNGGTDKVVKVLSDLYGLSLNEFRDLVKTQMLRDKVNQKVIDHLTVRHILIQVASDAPADQVDAAKTKAQGFLDQIKAGSITFADAATKYSEDSASASNGGLLDPFQRGDMVKPFSDAAFSLKKGQVSDLVKTDYGWHIIKLESRTGSVDKSFTDWLDDIQKKSLVLKLFKVT